MAAFARRCTAESHSSRWVDVNQLGASGEALSELFGDADIIFLDGVEQLGSLANFATTELLTQLQEKQRVVMAGRDSPDATLLADSHLRGMIEVLPLGNHSEAESRAYLTLRDVPKEHHEAAFDVTFGHPLALGLISEVYSQSPNPKLDLGARPDIVQSLLGRLLEGVPSADHRRALWCVAMPRALPAELLAAMLPNANSDDLFEWLMKLSIIRPLREGLVPHDIARAALFADLNWRAPMERREFGIRALAHYCDRAEQEPARAHELTRDFSHIYRAEITNSTSEPIPFYSGNAKKEEWSALEEMVETHEGAESLELFRFWRDGPIETDVLKNEHGEIAAFQLGIWLHQVDAKTAALDPGVASLYRALDSIDALNDERGVYYSRFWMARDSHHRAGAAAHAIADTIWGKTVRYSIALGFFVHTKPQGYLTYNKGSVEHWSSHDFRVGEHDYGVLGHDYRNEPIMDWVRRSMLGIFESTTAPSNPHP